MGITAPELFTKDHNFSNFFSGKPELDVWLLKKALNSQNRNNARTYVVKDSTTEEVVGYYAIAMGSVQREHAIANLRRNSPNPIPMVVLARLAVHENYHGIGIGSGLLKDCVQRSVHAMEVVGGAGILVHAIDQTAKTFYKKFGFQQSSFDEMILMARICDIKAAQH